MDRRGEAREIANDASAKRDDGIRAGKAVLAELAQHALEGSEILKTLAVADQVRGHIESGLRQTSGDDAAV